MGRINSRSEHGRFSYRWGCTWLPHDSPISIFCSWSLQQRSADLIWEPQQYLRFTSLNQNRLRSMYTMLVISLFALHKKMFWPQCSCFSFCLQRLWYQWGQSRVYILLQVLSLATALAFLQSCTRTGPIFTAGSKAFPASKRSASPSWNGKGAPVSAAVASGTREISVYETGFYLHGVIHHNTPTLSSVLCKLRAVQKTIRGPDLMLLSLSAK